MVRKDICATRVEMAHTGVQREVVRCGKHHHYLNPPWLLPTTALLLGGLPPFLTQVRLMPCFAPVLEMEVEETVMTSPLYHEVNMYSVGPTQP